MGSVSTWVRQVRLLVWKNIKLQLRDIRGTVLAVAAPFLFV